MKILTYASFFKPLTIFCIRRLYCISSCKNGTHSSAKKKESQLKAEKIQLETDKSNLQDINGDLAKITSSNQQRIVALENKVKSLSDQVLQCQEILSSVSRIREQFEITTTKQFYKKHGNFLANDDIYVSEDSNDDIYVSEDSNDDIYVSED